MNKKDEILALMALTKKQRTAWADCQREKIRLVETVAAMAFDPVLFDALLYGVLLEDEYREEYFAHNFPEIPRAIQRLFGRLFEAYDREEEILNGSGKCSPKN
jgi:hypothetical protein